MIDMGLVIDVIQTLALIALAITVWLQGKLTDDFYKQIAGPVTSYSGGVWTPPPTEPGTPGPPPAREG